MKKLLVFPLVAAMLGGAATASAQNEKLAAKPIVYTFVMPEVETLPFNLKPMGVEKTGCQITFLLAGNGLTDIGRDAVSITSITAPDGKDISKNSRGRDAWEFNSFSANVSDDGKQAVFTIFVATEKPLTTPAINGSVTVKAAGATKTETVTFKTADMGKEQKAGPFTFACENDDDDDFQIIMKGDRSLVSEMKVTAGGREIKQQGFFGFNNQTTYSFASAPTTPEFTLTVTYYTELRDVVYTIGK